MLSEHVMTRLGMTRGHVDKKNIVTRGSWVNAGWTGVDRVSIVVCLHSVVHILSLL